jgi:DtxR family Mn-dependent transcriptional regulator
MNTKSEHRSESTDNYLETILGLEADKGAARVKDVAMELGLLKGSVSGAMKKLKARGYIDYVPYHPIRLTVKGRRIGEKIVWRNRILSQFLIDVLKMDPQTARRAARRMGPAAEEQVVDNMQNYMAGFTKKRPALTGGVVLEHDPHPSAPIHRAKKLVAVAG